MAFRLKAVGLPLVVISQYVIPGSGPHLDTHIRFVVQLHDMGEGEFISSGPGHLNYQHIIATVRGKAVPKHSKIERWQPSGQGGIQWMERHPVNQRAIARVTYLNSVYLNSVE